VTALGAALLLGEVPTLRLGAAILLGAAALWVLREPTGRSRATG
jgi:hypothetical protein